MNKLHKKSFIRQQDQSDCGVACIASLVKYYGGDIRLEKLRELSGTSKQGTTMLGLFQAGQQIGFDVEAFEGDIPNLQKLETPCILHVLMDNRLQHYVICYPTPNPSPKGRGTSPLSSGEGSGVRFLISDPAQGVKEYSAEELEKIWQSKALLVLKPNDKFVKAGKIKAEKWFWLKKLIEEDMNILGIALVMGIAIAFLSLSTAVFSQKLIDDILPGNKLMKLWIGLALLFFLMLVRSGLIFIRSFFLNRQGKDFNNRIISHFYGSLLHLPKSFFDNRKTGELVARMNDTVRIQNALAYIGANLMIDVLLIIITAFFIMAYSWQLGVIGLLSIPLYFLSVFFFHKEIVDNQRKVMAAYAKNEANYVDTIQGVGVIKVSNKEEFFSGITKTIYDFFQQRIYNLGIVRIKFNMVTEVLGTMLVVGIITWGSVKVLNADLLLGQFMAVIQMVGILMPAAGRLAMTNIQLQEAKVAFDRMFEYTSIQPEFDLEKDKQKNNIQTFESLEVKNLVFRFPGRKPLITDVSFSMKKGEMIALLGESGCGKSTTMQILQKFYKHESGTIYVNGTDWEKISAVGWRNILGVVPQDIKIFSGTLIDNISMGGTLKDSSDGLKPSDDLQKEAENIVKFCQQYGFDKFFMQFPQNYFTILGEEGVNISGGQQQLVALARALYRKPQILLLDEATAAMDRNTEAFILELLHKLKSQISIVMVTHRVKTAKKADCIYVMENGMVKAMGKHEELLTTENLYSVAWRD